MSKRLEWVVHVKRSNCLLKEALVGKLNGKIPRGRLKQSWTDRIKDDLIKCTEKITI